MAEPMLKAREEYIESFRELRCALYFDSLQKKKG